MSVQIPLRRAGEVVAYATVDDELAPMLGLWKWSLNGSGYAYGSPGFMHRAILGLGRRVPAEVDHIDRDRLNNRRENLRLATRTENVHNSYRYEDAIDDRGRIGDLWAAGYSRREIAAAIGRNYQFVVKALHGERRDQHPNLVWTRERCVEFIQSFYAEHGRLPSGADMDGQNGRPWFTTIYRRFTSMAEARDAAGFSAVDLRRVAA